MMPGCPSDLRLERFLRNPEGSGCAEHVETCESCHARIASMLSASASFAAHVYPATLDRILERYRRRSALSRWLFVAIVPSTAALAFVCLRPSPSPSENSNLRGADMTFTVFTSTRDGVRRLKSGDDIGPGSPLRFEVRPPSTCWLTVVTVDGDGQVSKLFPAESDAVEISAAGPLPGGARLDANSGPERLFALCARRAINFQDLAGTKALRPGRDEVRRLARFPGLDSQTAQATVLVEKQP